MNGPMDLPRSVLPAAIIAFAGCRSPEEPAAGPEGIRSIPVADGYEMADPGERFTAFDQQEQADIVLQDEGGGRWFLLKPWPDGRSQDRQEIASLPDLRQRLLSLMRDSVVVIFPKTFDPDSEVGRTRREDAIATMKELGAKRLVLQKATSQLVPGTGLVVLEEIDFP